MELMMIKKAMKDNSIDKYDVANAIEFVEQLLEMEIEDVKENHPSATITINELMVARSRVTDLYHEVSEVASEI